jgi:signal transduction histidine kinase
MSHHKFRNSGRGHGNSIATALPETLRSFVSHELRAPLTCVDGALKLMTSEQVQLGPEQVAELISVASSSAQQLVLLVDRLLNEPGWTNSASAGAADLSYAPSRGAAGLYGNSGQTQLLKLLMVEDDSNYFRLVRQVLERCSTPSFKVNHVTELRSLAEYSRGDSIDVILLDLTLPDSQGLDTVRTARNMCPRIPIIVLTGVNDEQIGLQALAEGAEDYLVKQRISNDSLLRCIQYAITRKKFEESTMRLAAISDFTNTLVHDLKEPLVASKDVLHSLASQDMGPLNAQQSEIVAALCNSTDRQLELVRKLVEVYKYDLMSSDLAFEPVDVDTIFTDTIAQLAGIPRATDKVSIELSDDCPSIWGDRDALGNLFRNLLDNALIHGDNQRAVTVRSVRDGHAVSLQFHNWGTPIPQEVTEGMRDRFWRGIPGKTYVAKSGMGLYQAQRIVFLHGGKMSCRSDEESGTTVIVRLPACD